MTYLFSAWIRLRIIVAAVWLPLILVGTSPDSGSTYPDGLPGTWQRINPGGGGAFQAIGAGPTGIVVAASDLSGAYISTNRGLSWQVVGAAQGLTTTHVDSVGFDATDASLIYLGTESGIFRSTNSGKTFTKVNATGYISDIRFAKSNTSTGYAAVHSGYNVADGMVYKTADHGLNWSRASDASLPGGYRILKLVVDPANSNTLMALTGDDRFAFSAAHLYRSSNGGVSWSRIGAMMGSVMDIAIDPFVPNTLYASTAYNRVDAADGAYNTTCAPNAASTDFFYRSTDSGATWTKRAARTGAIWVDRAHQNTVRLIDARCQFPWEPARNGVRLSTDGGATWSLVSDVSAWDGGWSPANSGWAYGSGLGGAVKSFGDDLSDPAALWWATSQFVFATFDNGLTFGNRYTRQLTPGHWQSTGIDNIVPLVLSMSAADPNHIYLGAGDMGCWHSDNGGASWMNCNDPTTTGSWGGRGGNATAVLADPSRPGVVWVSNSQTVDGTQPHTLERTSDHGLTWTSANAGLPVTAGTTHSGLSLDRNSPVSNRTLYIASHGDIYRSVNDGLNWTHIFACGACQFTAVDAFASNTIYAGGSAGFFRSTDGGATWAPSGPAEFAGIKDASGGWVTSFWGRYWNGVAVITPDPVNAGWVYVAAYGPGRGLYRSKDAGSSWTKLRADDFLRDVQVHPTSANVLYTASTSAGYDGGYSAASNGVMRSIDGGATWVAANSGLAWPFANAIVIDPNNPSTVYISSPGEGIHKRVFAQSPALISPTGLVTATLPTFRWNAVPGAISYQLWVNDYTTPNVAGFVNTTYTPTQVNCAIGAICSAAPGTVFAAASAEWWVTAFYGDGSSARSTSLTFAVSPSATVTLTRTAVATSTPISSTITAFRQRERRFQVVQHL